MHTPSATQSLLALSCLFCTTLASADVTPDNPSLDEIVVTATRTAQTVDETLAAVTVIGRKEIERSGAHSLPELLNGLVGVSITQNGGFGAASTVRLRGTNAGHVLVLVDGIKVGSATLGQFDWEHISPALVERIEVVRGPLSRLYGSEAVGGVVQIFTRKKTEKGLTGQVKGGIGNRGTQETSAALAGSDGTHFFNLTASRFATDGFNSLTRDGQSSEPDNDGYSNRSLSTRLGRRFSKGDVEVTWMQVVGKVDVDDFYYKNDTVQQTGGIKLSLNLTNALDITARGSLSKDEMKSFKDGASTGIFTTESSSFGLQSDYQLTDNHIVTTGVDFRKEDVSGTTDYAIASRDLLGLFGQYQAAWDKHDFQVGMRWDDIESVGNRTTYNLAWGYELPYDMRLTASHGTGFKAPTFNDLYFLEVGNPDLKPEKSASWELGLDGKVVEWNWSLRGFQTKIDDLIGWVPVIPGDFAGDWAPVNINSAKIQGVEGALAGHFQGWDIGLNTTWMDPKDEDTGKRLAARPTKIVKLDLDRALTEKVRFGTTWQLQNHQYSDPSNTREAAGYGVVNLRSEYAFSKTWLAKATVKNLLDQQYQSTKDYNALGRMAMVTLEWNGDLL